MTAEPGRRWGDPRTKPPADPWTAHGGHTATMPAPVPHRANGKRPVYGRVYELFTTRPDLDGEHPYVGQTVQTVAERKRGHKSREDIRRDPWKARIIDGPRGHRLIKTVYATDDPRADQLMLDLAEAFAIEQIGPTHNDQRPIRPMPGVVLPSRPAEKRRPARRPTVRRRRPLPWRVLLFLIVTAPIMATLAGVTGMGSPSGSPAPFVAAVFGVGLGWVVTRSLLRILRTLGVR